MVRGLLGENMIYPEFDKFSIENLQQQLIVLYAQIAQERDKFTQIFFHLTLSQQESTAKR